MVLAELSVILTSYGVNSDIFCSQYLYYTTTPMMSMVTKYIRIYTIGCENNTTLIVLAEISVILTTDVVNCYSF